MGKKAELGRIGDNGKTRRNSPYWVEYKYGGGKRIPYSCDDDNYYFCHYEAEGKKDYRDVYYEKSSYKIAGQYPKPKFWFNDFLYTSDDRKCGYVTEIQMDADGRITYNLEYCNNPYTKILESELSKTKPEPKQDSVSENKPAKVNMMLLLDELLLLRKVKVGDWVWIPEQKQGYQILEIKDGYAYTSDDKRYSKLTLDYCLANLSYLYEPPFKRGDKVVINDHGKKDVRQVVRYFCDYRCIQYQFVNNIYGDSVYMDEFELRKLNGKKL